MLNRLQVMNFMMLAMNIHHKFFTDHHDFYPIVGKDNIYDAILSTY